MIDITVNNYRVNTLSQNFSNVVTTVDTSLTKKVIVDNVEKEVTINRLFNLSVPDENSFIDISNVSTNTIISWISSSLQDDIVEIEASFLKSYSSSQEQQTLEKLKSIVESYKNIVIKLELKINELNQQENE